MHTNMHTCIFVLLFEFYIAYSYIQNIVILVFKSMFKLSLFSNCNSSKTRETTTARTKFLVCAIALANKPDSDKADSDKADSGNAIP